MEHKLKLGTSEYAMDLGVAPIRQGLRKQIPICRMLSHIVAESSAETAALSASKIWQTCWQNLVVTCLPPLDLSRHRFHRLEHD